MAKKVAGAAVVLAALIGVYTLFGAAAQLRTDYQNFRRMVIWVAQKQAQEEQARQRQEQQRAAPATNVTPTPTPALEPAK